jgi:hypothetical protein
LSKAIILSIETVITEPFEEILRPHDSLSICVECEFSKRIGVEIVFVVFELLEDLWKERSRMPHLELVRGLTRKVRLLPK